MTVITIRPRNLFFSLENAILDRSDTNWSRDFEPSELTSNTDTPTARIVLSVKAILIALIYNLEPARGRWYHLIALIYNRKLKEEAEALIPATDEVPKTV